MSTVENFNTFKEQNPNWMKDYNVVQTTGNFVNYGRVCIEVDQYVTEQMVEKIIKAGKTPEVKAGGWLKIKYACAINLNNGNVYLDCDKAKIMRKNAMLIAARIPYNLIAKPIFHFVKTLYHLTFILPMIHEISKVIAKPYEERTFCEYGKAILYRGVVLNMRDIAQNLISIPLAPVYWAALTVVHVAGVILGLANSDLIYKQRELAYQIDLASNWGDRKSYFMMTVAPCFGPMYGNIADKKAKDTKEFKKYEDEYKEDLKNYEASDKKGLKPTSPTPDEADSLKNFARKQIDIRQTTRLPGNGCAYLPGDKHYTSPAWPSDVKEVPNGSPVVSAAKTTKPATAKQLES